MDMPAADLDAQRVAERIAAGVGLGYASGLPDLANFLTPESLTPR